MTGSILASGTLADGMQPRFEMCQFVWVCSFLIMPQPGEEHAWIPTSPRKVINMEHILICYLEPSLARFRQNELNSGRTTDIIHEWQIKLIVMCLWDFVAVCYIAIPDKDPSFSYLVILENEKLEHVWLFLTTNHIYWKIIIHLLSHCQTGHHQWKE